MSAVELSGVHVVHRARGAGLFGRDRVHALTGADLTVAPGETVGVVGESGCGKSTLTKVLVGIQRPTSGTVARRDCLAAATVALTHFACALAARSPRQRTMLRSACQGSTRSTPSSVAASTACRSRPSLARACTSTKVVAGEGDRTTDSTSSTSALITRDVRWAPPKCSRRLWALYAWRQSPPVTQRQRQIGKTTSYAPRLVAYEPCRKYVEGEREYGTRVDEKAVLEEHLRLPARVYALVHTVQRLHCKA